VRERPGRTGRAAGRLDAGGGAPANASTQKKKRKRGRKRHGRIPHLDRNVTVVSFSVGTQRARKKMAAARASRCGNGGGSSFSVRQWRRLLLGFKRGMEALGKAFIGRGTSWDAREREDRAAVASGSDPAGGRG